MYDDSIGAVYGNSVTEIDYNSDYYYDAYVESYLYENGNLVDSNYAESATGTASAMTAAWADPNSEYTETGYHDLYVRFGNEDRYPEGCMPCDGCNTDCYWDNWYYYDAYGFSFASTGSYGPWFDLFGEGPPTYLENNQEEYIGETSASTSTPAGNPDHLQIMNDVTRTISCDNLQRLITYRIVDANNQSAGSRYVRESESSVVDTYTNQAPDADLDCDTSPGTFTDGLSTGCPQFGDYDCGYDIPDETWLWCSGFESFSPLAKFDYNVHHNRIVVSGYAGRLPLHWFVRNDGSIHPQ